MSFICDETWAKIGAQVVRGFDKSRIKHGAYELSMGNEYYVTANKGKREVADGKQFHIPAGQLALLITKEEASIPKNHIGWISIKATSKIQGLINVSGFHVDPEFQGKIKFTVYNASSRDISLEAGAPTFLLWIASFDGDCEGYSGKYQSQSKITIEDINKLKGTLPSPVRLDKRISRLENILKLLLLPIIGILIAWTINFLTRDNSQTTSGKGLSVTSVGAYYESKIESSLKDTTFVSFPATDTLRSSLSKKVSNSEHVAR